MVSYYGPNMGYPGTASAWYGTNFPNNPFLNAASTHISAGQWNGILDSDAAASSFYNAHHHHMLQSTNPDWAQSNYNFSTPNSQFFANGITPPTSLHLSPTINNYHNSSSVNPNGDHSQNGLQIIPPSPSITYNSACSAMSSPDIESNGNGDIGNSEALPNIPSNCNLSRSKSPYEWLKKPSCSNQVNSVKTRTKDKYRVVYTDYQRCELEKEYVLSPYITIPQKSKLAESLELSERQVKIWFQNRRAKCRKQTNKAPTNGRSFLPSSCANVAFSMPHHSMNNGPSGLGTNAMYDLDTKPKLEPGFFPPGHPSQNYGHLQQAHVTHPMHHLSSMGMNLFNQSHMHHPTASGFPPSIPSPTTTIPAQAHMSSC